MIKLLIVDDEKTIRNGLQRHIDWNGLGVDMVQSAASAEEALMICDEFIPDIVLSDIRMRGMTGVEMCTKIHALYPECQIIFVSGYSDKEYLKAAISVGAVAYIEKPVVPELLIEAVKKAIASCRELHMKATADVALERSRGILGQIVLRALAYNDYADDFENSLEFLEILPGKFACYRMCVLRAEHRIPNLISVQKELRRILSYLPAVGNKGMMYGAFLDDRDFCLLLAGEEEEVADDSTVMAALCSMVGSMEVQGHRFFLAGGLCVSNWNMLHDSFESTRVSMQDLFFKGWGHFTLKATSRPGKAVSFDKRPVG